MTEVTAAESDMIVRAIAEAADSAGLGVSVTARDGTHVEVLFINAAMLDLLGATEAQVRERGVLSFVAPDQLPRVMEFNAERERRGNGPGHFQTFLRRGDGQRLPVEISTSRVTLDGRLGNVTFVSDISALSRSEERFTRLVEGAPDGVVILRWPTILFMNREAARLIGLRDPAQGIGTNLTDYLVAAEVPDAETRVMLALGAHARFAPREYTGRDPDGRPLAVEVSAIPIEYDGAPAMLAFARDVTERKAVFAKLARADKLAAVGTLAAGVAHEINNPLGYLLLNLDIVRRELPRLGGDLEKTAVLLGRLEECKHGAERVKTIVHDLQSFTRKDEDIRGPVDLNAVVMTAIHLARHQLGAGIRITHDLGELPAAHGNATRLEQLVLNLLINAIHAIQESGRGDGEIHVQTSHGDGRVEVRVRDNGVGMTPDLQAHVFEPFFTTKPPGVGTGLGLPICLGIARAVGGDVHLDSTAGAGTTVTLELTLHPEQARGGGSDTGAPAGTVHPGDRRDTGAPDDTAMRSAPRRHARLLLIDDERAVLTSLAAALEEHDVVSCASAEEARAQLDDGSSFDLVVCDLQLRKESGIDVHQYAVERHPDLARRFIFMTGGAFLPETQRFLAALETPHLEKPFELSALRRLVDEVLAR